MNSIYTNNFHLFGTKLDTARWAHSNTYLQTTKQMIHMKQLTLSEIDLCQGVTRWCHAQISRLLTQHKIRSVAIIRGRGREGAYLQELIIRSDHLHHGLYLQWLRQVGRAGGGVGCAFCERGAAVVGRKELRLLRAGACRHHHWCSENY